MKLLSLPFQKFFFIFLKLSSCTIILLHKCRYSYQNSKVMSSSICIITLICILTEPKIPPALFGGLLHSFIWQILALKCFFWLWRHLALINYVPNNISTYSTYSCSICKHQYIWHLLFEDLYDKFNSK